MVLLQSPCLDEFRPFPVGKQKKKSSNNSVWSENKLERERSTTTLAVYTSQLMPISLR
jgi:hypothetical protein